MAGLSYKPVVAIKQRQAYDAALRLVYNFVTNSYINCQQIDSEGRHHGVRYILSM